jgi:hypothetical protein
MTNRDLYLFVTRLPRTTRSLEEFLRACGKQATRVDRRTRSR